MDAAPDLFHVHLTVTWHKGTFVGRMTPEPLQEEAALAMKTAYAENVFNAESLILPAVDGDKHDTLVLPVDVLRKSALLLSLVPWIDPRKPQELDFGSASGWRGPLPKQRDV